MKALKATVVILALAALAACGGGGGGGGGGSDKSSGGGGGDDGGGGDGGGGDTTTSVRIELDFGAISGALMLPPGQNFAQAPPSDVLAVRIEVLNGATSLGVFPMTLSGTWGVTIPSLPVGPSLTFQARGYNSTITFNATTLIYTGTTVKTLANLDPDTVSISMDPVGITVTFPQITSITIPSQFETNATGTIAFGLASSASPLGYALTAGAGSFSPAAGSIAMAGGTATLNTNFTAPSAAGTYSHSITVTNPDDFSVAQDFSTTVVAATTDVTVTVIFAPALTALLAERTPYNGTNIVWQATAEDDVTAAGSLVFGWSFANGSGSTASFAPSTTATATLQNYNPATTTGVLTLTITDGAALTTTITYTLPLGQFPTY